MQNQWQIQERGLRGPGPPFLCLDETEARRDKKNFFGDWAPPTFSKDLDDRPHPPYLKVWIRHWKVLPNWFHLNGNTIIIGFCWQIQKIFF